MPLRTKQDEDTLDSIRFRRHYYAAKNLWRYRLEGKRVCAAVANNTGFKQLGVKLEPEHVEGSLAAALQACPVFIKKLERHYPFASPLAYDQWAIPAARFMLDLDWDEIS
ncbi:hypothetical protein PQR34_25875 [Paraburkholderia sediminicola]|uniref:hypothetical protein n=1 Tax=Paraburkholderia sediminicola TaxID=458836 RepID=UPI0038B7F112